MLPRQEVIILSMSVTDGMRLVISGGAVRPPTRMTAADVPVPMPLPGVGDAGDAQPPVS